MSVKYAEVYLRAYDSTNVTLAFVFALLILGERVTAATWKWAG